jgi:hypothetical protein
MGPAGAPSMGGGVTPPPQLAPQPAAPGAPATRTGGFAIDPGTRAAIAANIYLPKEAADAVEKQAATEREAALAGPRKYAETQAESEAKRQAGKPAERQQIGTTLDSIETTRALATKIRDNKNLPGALGYFGKGNAAIHSGIRDVSADLETLLGRVALDTMARLKQQSATGATGFGSTNETEFEVIQNSLTNLKNRLQTPEQYRQNIDTLLTSLENAERRIYTGWQETYREPYRNVEQKPYPTSGPKPEKTEPGPRPRGMPQKEADTGNAAFLAPPKVGEIRNGRPFLGGDPKKQSSWGPKKGEKKDDEGGIY